MKRVELQKGRTYLVEPRGYYGRPQLLTITHLSKEEVRAWGRKRRAEGLPVPDESREVVGRVQGLRINNGEVKVASKADHERAYDRSSWVSPLDLETGVALNTITRPIDIEAFKAEVAKNYRRQQEERAREEAEAEEDRQRLQDRANRVNLELGEQVLEVRNRARSGYVPYYELVYTMTAEQLADRLLGEERP